MTKTKGYVLPRGEKNDVVSDDITIYAAPTCQHVIRRGKTKTSNKANPSYWFNHLDTVENYMSPNYNSIESAVNEATGKAALDGIVKNAAPGAIGSIGSKLVKGKTIPVDKVLKVDSEELITTNTKAEYNSILEAGSGGFTQQPAAVKMAVRKEVENAILVPDMMIELAKETAVPIPDTIMEEDNSNPQYKSKLDQFMQESTKTMNDFTDTAKACGASEFIDGGAAAVVSKWLDDLEAEIDALPTMSQMGSDVYEVEIGVDPVSGLSAWLYTGNSTPMDRSLNQHIQQMKAKACAFLNKQMSKITKKGEDMLQEHISKTQMCEPALKIMTLIKKVPSLGTIIDWAKSIVNIFTMGYKMVFGIYKMIRQVLEMIIMRIPMLINKALQKITEFDCPLAGKMDIKINSEEV